MKTLNTIALVAICFSIVTVSGCRNWGGGCATGNCNVPYTSSFGPVQPAPAYSANNQNTTIQNTYQNPAIQAGGGYGTSASGLR